MDVTLTSTEWCGFAPSATTKTLVRFCQFKIFQIQIIGFLLEYGLRVDTEIAISIIIQVTEMFVFFIRLALALLAATVVHGKIE
jgi:hypothetical protein